MDRVGVPRRRVVQVQGAVVTLSYVDAGEDRTGPSVVLVHGLGGRWRYWMRAIPALSARRHVLAVDLLGFGESSLPVQDLDVAFFADAIAALARELELERLVFVGHSFGGPLGTIFASRYPALTERLVMVAGTIQSFQATLARRVRPWLTRPLMAAATVAELLYTPLPLPRRARDLIARSPLLRALALWPFVRAPRRFAEKDVLLLLEGTGAAGVLPTARALANATGWDQLRIEVPVWLINADHDLIAPLADLRAYRGRADQTLLVRGTGHLPMLEAPQALAAALIAAVTRGCD